MTFGVKSHLLRKISELIAHFFTLRVSLEKFCISLHILCETFLWYVEWPQVTDQGRTGAYPVLPPPAGYCSKSNFQLLSTDNCNRRSDSARLWQFPLQVCTSLKKFSSTTVTLLLYSASILRQIHVGSSLLVDIQSVGLGFAPRLFYLCTACCFTELYALFFYIYLGFLWVCFTLLFHKK